MEQKHRNMFDTIVKGIVVLFFDQKLIYSSANKAAMKDHKVKTHVNQIRKDI